MAASVEEIPIDRKLDDIFEEAYNLYNGFDDCADPTNSPDFQVSDEMARRVIKMCDASQSYNQTFICFIA